MAIRVLIALVLLLLLPASVAVRAGEAPAAPPEQSAAAPAMTPEEKADAEIGKAAAESVEKQYKIVKDSPALPRINAIIDRLRPVTQKSHQSYQVKVINSRAINAFSLPGGYLYFTQGLLDAVESDDELAAVAAHEMAHACLSHSRTMMRKSDRYNKILGPLVLAAILAETRQPVNRRSGRTTDIDPGALLMVGSMVVEDALNHYGRGAELEADHQAVLYLHASKAYHPVAMLTVAEGLAHMEGGEAPFDPGVFQTHPYAEERVAAIIGELNELKVPIERRRVTKSIVASAAAVSVEGREVGELRLATSGGVAPWSASVFQPATTSGGISPLARVQRAAEALNALLLADLRSFEITLIAQSGGATVQARGQPLFTITPEDAAFHKSTVDKLAQQALQAIRSAFQQEKVGRAY